MATINVNLAIILAFVAGNCSALNFAEGKNTNGMIIAFSAAGSCALLVAGF